MRVWLLVAGMVAAAPVANAIGPSPSGYATSREIIDPAAEVAAAEYQSAATIAALKKSDSAMFRADAARIESLETDLRAGDVRHRAELKTLQETLVADLSAKDRAYAQAIAIFRGAVTHIIETPEGLLALKKSNEGDAIGANAILEKLNDANDAALQKATDIEKAVGRRDQAALAFDNREKGKIATATVILLYERVVRLDPGVFADWVILVKLYSDAGRLTAARNAAETAAALAGNDRERLVSLGYLGDVSTSQGDLAKAGKVYRESVEIAQRLAASDPSNADLGRDLSISLDRVGQALASQGHLAAAAKAHRESLAISRSLAATNPSNAGLQRDVAGGLSQLGDVLNAQGDLIGASAAYADSLEIVRSLAAADPSNLGLQADVSASFENVADLLTAQGDLEGATKAYGEGLQIARRLAASDPSKAAFERFVFVSLLRLGYALHSRGDLAGAGKVYVEGLEIARHLAASDPSDADLQRDVCLGLERVGDVLASQGDPRGAGKAYGEELIAIRRLAVADPSNADLQRDVAITVERVGDILAAQGDPAGAGSAYRESLDTRRRLAASDALNAVLQRDVYLSLYKLAGLAGSGVTWPDVLAQMEAMDERNMLAPVDRAHFSEVRMRAAQQQTK